MTRNRPAELTADRLRQVLHYDPETGVFTRLRTGKPVRIPARARYLGIGVDGGWYRAHRLAVLYMTGAWPLDQVDHDNRVKIDNRWENLRPATNEENKANMGAWRTNKLGFRGVRLHHRGKKYRATFRGKSLGLYDTPEKAAEVYREAARKVYGEFVPRSDVAQATRKG